MTIIFPKIHAFCNWKSQKIESLKRWHFHWWKGFRKIISKNYTFKIPKDCQKHLEQRFLQFICSEVKVKCSLSVHVSNSWIIIVTSSCPLKLNKILMFVSITAAVFRGHHYFILCFFRENIKNYDSFNGFLSKKWLGKLERLVLKVLLALKRCSNTFNSPSSLMLILIRTRKICVARFLRKDSLELGNKNGLKFIICTEMWAFKSENSNS